MNCNDNEKLQDDITEKMSNRRSDGICLILISLQSLSTWSTSMNHQLNQLSAEKQVHLEFPDLETECGEDESENWRSKWEFIFSCVGLSVGIHSFIK